MTTTPTTQHGKDEKKTTPPNGGGAQQTATQGKPTDNRPPATQLGAQDDKKKAPRVAKQVFVIYAPVMVALDVTATPVIKEFKNRAEAEKWLNTDATAPKDFTVIIGNKLER